MPGMAQKGAALADQTEVHSPGVDTHRGDAREPSGGDPEALEDLPVEVEDIPVEPFENADGPVGKTVDHIKADRFAAPGAGDEPSALGAQVDGQDLLGA